jgi:cardiolipin synthase
MAPATPSTIASNASRELVLAPNLLSFSRVPLAVVFAFEVGAGHERLALATLAVAAATDVADGYWARRFHQETAIGRVLDPAADKIFFVTAVIALVRAERLAPVALLLLGTREIVQLMIATVLTARGALVSASAATPASAAGKLTTTLQTAAVAAALVWLDARGPFVIAAAVCGLVAGADYWVASTTSASSRSYARDRPCPDSRTGMRARASAGKRRAW